MTRMVSLTQWDWVDPAYWTHMQQAYPSPHVELVGRTATFYVSSIPLTDSERALYSDLLKRIPPNPTYGLMIKKWSDYYPDLPWLGTFLGLKDPLSQKPEVLVQYKDFDTARVPWDKLNPLPQVL